MPRKKAPEVPYVPPFTPSKYQEAIFEYIKGGSGNLVVKAVAGGSKTTTAVTSLHYVPKDKKALFLAFNKTIAETLQARVPKHVRASTIHAYGYSVVKRLYPYAQMDEDKVYNIIREMGKAGDWDIPKSERVGFTYRLERLVNLMRLTLRTSEGDCWGLCEQFDIDSDYDEPRYAVQVYNRVVRERHTFDFTDMVFIPATEHFATKGFDIVYVDEFQDCNQCQYTFIKKLVKPDTGRLVVVGDPNQAIYGYIGAKSTLFDDVLAMPNTIELPLSISYRCCTSVVDWAKQIVPVIEPRENAPVGTVVSNGSITNVKDGDFVLCRTNFPLVCLCMEFLKNGRKALIKGSDTGRNLVSFIKGYELGSLDDMFKGIEDKRQKLIKKLVKDYPDRAIESLSKFQAFEEKSNIIRVLSENVTSVKAVMDKIVALFTDDSQEGIVLSTVHKAKGLESERVFIVEPQLIPFPFYNNSESELQAERNIDYVARTRAINHLEYIRDWTCYKKK